MLAPSQTVQDLQRARNLIADPARWTVGCRFRNFAGELVIELDETCVSFCAVGALYKIVDAPNDLIYWLCAIAEELYPDSARQELVPLAHVNDTYGQAAALACYDRAIALAMAGEG